VEDFGVHGFGQVESAAMGNVAVRAGGAKSLNGFVWFVAGEKTSKRGAKTITVGGEQRYEFCTPKKPTPKRPPNDPISTFDAPISTPFRALNSTLMTPERPIISSHIEFGKIGVSELNHYS
jgi:hypothetical protein